MNTDYLIDGRGNVLIVIGDEVENTDARFFVGAINTSQELCSIDKTKPFSALGNSPLRNCIEQGNYSASAKTLRVIKARVALAAPVVPDTQSQDLHIGWQERAAVLYDDGGTIYTLTADEWAQHQAVPEGYKLLKDTTGQDRDWPDDSLGVSHLYCNACHNCLRQFIGHKRRVTCRSCASVPEGDKNVD